MEANGFKNLFQDYILTPALRLGQLTLNLSYGALEGAITVEQFSEEARRLIDSEFVAQKSAWLVNSRDAADAYAQTVDEPRSEIIINHEVHQDVYEPVRYVTDIATGMRGTIARDKDGKTLLIFHGMTLPWNAYLTPGEPPGRFRQSVNEVVAARDGLVGPQTQAALRLYKEVLEDPETKQLQVIGFSLGSHIAEKIAAEVGQKTALIGALGSNEETVTERQKQNLRANAVNIYADNDPIGGFIGPTHARTIDVTSENALGWMHSPKSYGELAKKHIAPLPLRRPETWPKGSVAGVLAAPAPI